jgi:hypothetical protein
MTLTLSEDADAMLLCTERAQKATYGGVFQSQNKDAQLATESETFRASEGQVRSRQNYTKLFLEALKIYWTYIPTDTEFVKHSEDRTQEAKERLLQSARDAYDASWPSDMLKSVGQGLIDGYVTGMSTMIDAATSAVTLNNHFKYSTYSTEDSREAYMYGILLLVALTIPDEVSNLLDDMPKLKLAMNDSQKQALVDVLQTTKTTNSINNFVAPFRIMPRNPIFSSEVYSMSNSYEEFPKIRYRPRFPNQTISTNPAEIVEGVRERAAEIAENFTTQAEHAKKTLTDNAEGTKKKVAEFTKNSPFWNWFSNENEDLTETKEKKTNESTENKKKITRIQESPTFLTIWHELQTTKTPNRVKQAGRNIESTITQGI